MNTKKKYEELKTELILEIHKSALTGLLNPRVAKIEHEIEFLRSHCEHKFVNGICEYCEYSEN